MDKLVMTVPEGMTSISWQGQEYESFEGVVHVPTEAAADLVAHGLVPIENIGATELESLEEEADALAAEMVRLDEDRYALMERHDIVSQRIKELAADEAPSKGKAKQK